MKYFYIYKITNKVNGKIYIGKRTTKYKPEEDKYLGSGKMIKWAVSKYGAENFEKEILELCTKDNLSEREIYYIELYNCRNNEIGYNIIEGGYGVGDLCHDMKTYYNPETDQEIRIKETETPPEGFIHGRRPFTKETKEKMTRKGKENGMYGTCRIKTENPYWGITFIINKQTGERKPWHKKDNLPENYDYCPSYYKHLKQYENKINKLEKKLQINKNNSNLKIELFLAKKDLYEYKYGKIYNEKIDPELQDKLNEKLRIKEQKWKKFVKERYEKRQTKKKLIKERKHYSFEERTELKELWSEQRKQFWKTKEMETCPYCGKQGRGAGFYRWHLENCRNHPTRGEINKQMQKDLHKKLGECLKGRKGTTQDKICINNGIHNKFINKEDLNKYPGYKLGIIKKK